MRSPTFSQEVDRVVAAGYKEIVITGVHLGSYGRDLFAASSLASLMEALVSRAFSDADKPLFRVSSLEPMDFPAAIVVERGRPHFHLPLQHASNRVLERMRRPYTIEQYSALVDDIRARVPHAAIGSDVIVGFPGETDEDFERLPTTSSAHRSRTSTCFPYSDRPGTEASLLQRQGAWRSREGARRAGSPDLAGTSDTFPRVARWHDKTGADDRGRHGCDHG